MVQSMHIFPPTRLKHSKLGEKSQKKGGGGQKYVFHIKYTPLGLGRRGQSTKTYRKCITYYIFILFHTFH